jgi:hypothetical protein
LPWPPHYRQTFFLVTHYHRAGPRSQSNARQKNVDKVRPDIGEDAFRNAEETLQPTRVFLCRHALGNALIRIAHQHREQFPERQVRIADTGMRVAVADDNEQVLVVLLCPAREFGSEAGLAEACFSGDETDLTLSFDHQVQSVAELLEFLLPTYKYWFHMHILVSRRRAAFN